MGRDFGARETTFGGGMVGIHPHFSTSGGKVENSILDLRHTDLLVNSFQTFPSGHRVSVNQQIRKYNYTHVLSPNLLDLSQDKSSLNLVKLYFTFLHTPAEPLFLESSLVLSTVSLLWFSNNL